MAYNHAYLQELEALCSQCRREGKVEDIAITISQALQNVGLFTVIYRHRPWRVVFIAKEEVTLEEVPDKSQYGAVVHDTLSMYEVVRNANGIARTVCYRTTIDNLIPKLLELHE